MDSDVRKIADRLKMLANETRLQILCELIDGPKTVGTLVQRLNSLSQSAISQHLALLKAHGVVEDHRTGQNVTYSIADRRVEEIIAVLKRNYCGHRASPDMPPDKPTHG